MKNIFNEVFAKVLALSTILTLVGNASAAQESNDQTQTDNRQANTESMDKRESDGQVPTSPPTSVIVVTPTRTEHRVDEVAASVSVLTEKDFVHKNRQNAEDLLRDLEGLDFGRQASVAHQVYPTIRGVGGSFVGGTTQVLVDGFAQDAATSSVLGHGGLNFMDMQDIERVEVVRGPVSALYGYGAIGGVINIIPKRWKGEPGAEVNASYGSNATAIKGAAFGTATDRFDLRISYYDAKSDGFVARPERDAYGMIDYGPRNWSDHKFSLNGGYNIDERQELTYSYRKYETDSAISGGDRPFDRQVMEGESGKLGYQRDLSNDTTIKAQYQFTRLKQSYTYDEEDWNGDIGNFALAYSGARDSDTSSLLLEIDTLLSSHHHLIAGLSRDAGSAETHNAVVGVSEHTTEAGYLQDEFTLGALTLTAGVRYDHIDLSPITSDGREINGSGSLDKVISPRLSALYRLSDSTSIYASAGKAFLPALNNFKFVQPSTTRVDNPDLDPETSVSYELGMHNDLGWGKLRTALYKTDYKDKIALGIDSASGLNQWQNLSLRRVLGLEIALQADLGNGWQPYANYSHTQAEDQATDGAKFTDATRVAPNKVNLGFTYVASSAWSASLNGRWVSSMYFNNLSEAQKADSYFQADALLRMKAPEFKDKLDLFIACNNLTDKQYQPFNIGEWSDGRTFTIGVNGRF